jgi:hypothetical protein
MGELEINVPINLDYVVGALAHSGYDAEEFVISLDEAIGDEGFTLGVIKKLARSLADDYQESLVHVTGRVLENQFGENRDYFGWGADDIANYENATTTMKKIVELIESLEP